MFSPDIKIASKRSEGISNMFDHSVLKVLSSGRMGLFAVIVFEVITTYFEEVYNGVHC